MSVAGAFGQLLLQLLYATVRADANGLDWRNAEFRRRWFCLHQQTAALVDCSYPRRARSAIGVDIVFTLDVCMFVC